MVKFFPTNLFILWKIEQISFENIRQEQIGVAAGCQSNEQETGLISWL